MTEPEADPALELAELTTRIARTIKRAGSTRLAPLGITFGQARLLRTLAYGGPLRMSEVATRMEVVPRSATDLVDGLVAAGLVERRSHPSDRRAVLVAATAEGMERIRLMRAARQAVSTEVFGTLDPHQQTELAALLRLVVARLTENCSDTAREGNAR